MKNWMKFIAAGALCALLLGSCTEKETRFAQIKGLYTGEKTGKEIHLCKVEHGKTTKVAETKFGAEGRFGFNYSVEEPGLYVINIIWDKADVKIKKDHDLKRFYLENGTELEIKLNDGDYELLQTNSDKNKLLTKWNNQVDSVYTYSHGFSYTMLTYKDFFPLLPEFARQADEFKKTISTGDSSFDELMNLMVDVDMNSAALMMLYTPRSVHPKREDYPDYYDYLLSEGAPQSERVLDLPGGYDFIRLYSMYAVISSPEKPDRSQWHKAALDQIPNQLLKGYYAVENIRSFKAYDETYLDYKKMIEPYLLSDYLKEEVKAFEMTIRKFEAGAAAFDFAGTDVNGKEHKLSDFKGNLVYVDVWATWCGPCKAQIPALKELEKKFHGQPITFLSISVDKPKDRKKWENYVKDEQLKGIQLMADKAFDSDVAKAYGINAIPRFMLFDKEGKIVTIDAPRPSEEKTEGWLRKML